MQKEDLFNYVMNTPGNTNPAVLKSIIEAVYAESGSSGPAGNIVNITNNTSRAVPISQIKGGVIIDNRYYPGLGCAANDSISYNVFNQYVLRNDDYEIQYSVDVLEDVVTVTLNGTPIPFNDGYQINITSNSEIVGNTYNIVINDK